MFVKVWTPVSVLMAFGLHQVNAHGAVSPALGVSGTLVENDVQRPSTAHPCGSVNIANTIDTSTAVNAAADGSFQVTAISFDAGADGSRKVTAEVDTTGTGRSFAPITVTTNGDAAPSRSGPQNIVASLPAGTQCTGGAAKDKCLVQFVTTAGFGNCVVVQTSSSTSTTKNYAGNSKDRVANTADSSATSTTMNGAGDYKTEVATAADSSATSTTMNGDVKSKKAEAASDSSGTKIVTAASSTSTSDCEKFNHHHHHHSSVADPATTTTGEKKVAAAVPDTPTNPTATPVPGQVSSGPYNEIEKPSHMVRALLAERDGADSSATGTNTAAVASSTSASACKKHHHHHHSSAANPATATATATATGQTSGGQNNNEYMVIGGTRKARALLADLDARWDQRA